MANRRSITFFEDDKVVQALDEIAKSRGQDRSNFLRSIVRAELVRRAVLSDRYAEELKKDAERRET